MAKGIDDETVPDLAARIVQVEVSNRSDTEQFVLFDDRRRFLPSEKGEIAPDEPVMISKFEVERWD